MYDGCSSVLAINALMFFVIAAAALLPHLALRVKSAAWTELKVN